MLVLLGEVGGIEEYTVCDLLKDKRITKPIVAWCIGTCSDVFSTDVQVRSCVQTIHLIIENIWTAETKCFSCKYQFQFGHAGASASGVRETARAKNAALKDAGAVVPENFDELGDSIEGVYKVSFWGNTYYFTRNYYTNYGWNAIVIFYFIGYTGASWKWYNCSNEGSGTSSSSNGLCVG